MAETSIERLGRRHAALWNERQSYWDPHYKELQTWLTPRLGRFSTKQIINDGGKINSSIIDSTALQAIRVAAAGLLSGSTSPARPWFRLTTPDPDLMEFAPVKNWLWEVERRMRMVFQSSNIYGVLHQGNYELLTFGTATEFWLSDFDNIVRGVPVPVGEFTLATAANLTVDTVYREYSPKISQLVEEFGLKNCSESAQSLYNNGDYERRITVVHAVEPRALRDSTKTDGKNKRWASTYWEKGRDKPLREGGFDAKPFTATRWDVTGLDTYGRSPGMDALGDVKQLQFQQRKKAKAIDKLVDPPMVGPESLKHGVASILPGGITYADALNGQRASFYPAMEINPAGITAISTDNEEIRGRIQKAFFSDLFMAFMNEVKAGLKVDQVAHIYEEQLIQLGPVLERNQAERLDPLIDRVFSMLVEASIPMWRLDPQSGVIPAPPPELDAAHLRIDYISTLAQAQKAVATSSVERLSGFVGNLAAAYPEVLDKFDADQAVDEYADMLGAPPRIVVSDEVVAEKRQQRAQQQQAQQMMAAAQQGADTAKVLSQADTRPGNVLSSVLGVSQ